MNTSQQTDKQLLDKTHHLLSELYPIPLTEKKHKLGLSAILAFFPLGSTVSLFSKASYIIVAHKNNLSKKIKMKMYKEFFMGWLLGSIPIIGSITTWYYNADGKIYKMLSQELSQ